MCWLIYFFLSFTIIVVGLEMYAVGVGNNFTSQQLKGLVSSPTNNHLLVTDYNKLLHLVPRMLRKLKGEFF